MIFKNIVLLLFILLTCDSPVFGSGETAAFDLNGNPVNPLSANKAKAVVLIFLATDCPISNRYAPLVNRIYDTYKDKGIEFYAIYPSSMETKKDIETHRKDFGYKLSALTDKGRYLVKAAEAMVTPEVSVYLPGASKEAPWIYRGRIDNLFVDFGKWRHAPTENNLTDTLDAILADKPLEPRRTRAIGCYIAE